MKCPLSAKIDYMEDRKLHTHYQDCIKEACAWWRKEYPACCIYSIERALWAIAVELGTIMERMSKRRKA